MDAEGKKYDKTEVEMTDSKTVSVVLIPIIIPIVWLKKKGRENQNPTPLPTAAMPPGPKGELPKPQDYRPGGTEQEAPWYMAQTSLRPERGQKGRTDIRFAKKAIQRKQPGQRSDGGTHGTRGQRNPHVSSKYAINAGRGHHV